MCQQKLWKIKVDITKIGCNFAARSQHERGVPPWNLEEPHWVADAEAAQCANAQCNAKFTFVKRKVGGQLKNQQVNQLYRVGLLV